MGHWMCRFYLQHYHALRRNLAMIVVLVCGSLFLPVGYASPLIKEPKFVQVSTEQGLSQDTVRALLIDQDGFLWIGTDGGLNRFDGYRVEQVNGPDNELTDRPIYHLFQASNGELWVGTLESGLFKLNLEQNQLQKMGDWRFKNEPDWLQDTAHIIEPSEGQIYVALNQQVVHFDGEQPSTLFELEDELVFQQHSIRYLWSDSEILLIASTTGIYAIDLQTNKQLKIDHLGDVEANIDNNNVKFLLTRDNTLWIGTVEGMFSLPFDALKAYVSGGGKAPQPTQRVKDLNIWEIQPTDQKQLYLATNQGMYTYWTEENQLEHLFQVTDSRYYLTDNNIIDIIETRNGDFWMATQIARG